ncbi:potassium channel family protein [Vagococcus vulneris]|uniref:Potassium channel domain-containing protein n=1 Tax=Vagococcus vulneris TaxID=1977869 RepID=A0A429ZSU2_9ENTE|nr:potassium channel family protein [Vagococcus vulneris]RST96745.1 hypothetical protein CBF37_10815 [Vagococcus vulneris]
MLKKKVYYATMFILLIISGILSLINHHLAKPIDFLVLALFAFDTLYQLYLSNNRWKFIRHHPLEFVSLIPIYTGFRYFRLLPILLAFLRVTIMGRRYIIPVYNVLVKTGIGRFAWYFMLVFFLLPLPMIWIEPAIQNYSDLMWWTLQTVTTVGYGDIIVHHKLSKIIAGILMILGIGMISAFTSTITKLMTNPKLIRSEINKEKSLEKKALQNMTNSAQSSLAINELNLTLEDLHRLEALIQHEIKQKKN